MENKYKRPKQNSIIQIHFQSLDTDSSCASMYKIWRRAITHQLFGARVRDRADLYATCQSNSRRLLNGHSLQPFENNFKTNITLKTTSDN